MNTFSASTSSSKQPKKQWSWKSIATVLGLTLFFTGALVAVIIVQRQRMVQGPVAPTAPTSQPAASEIEAPTEACSLVFTIPEEAQPDAIKCIKKELANVAYPAANRKVYTSTDQLKRGDAVFVLIETNIGSKAGKVPATAEVVIQDDLPAGMKFVKSVVGPTPTVSGQKVTYRLPANTTIAQVQFEAEITDTAELGKVLTNTATVTSTQTSSSTTTCSAEVGLEKPAVGTVSCVSKSAYTDFFTNVTTNPGTAISADGSVLAGQEFVYSIMVRATAATTADAIVSDTLPAGLTYVGKRTGDTMTHSYDQATRKLTVNLGTFTASELTKTVEFKVKANADISVGSFKNTATVNLTGAAASAASSCEISLNTPPRGVAICKTKRALTDFSSKGGTPLPYKADPAGSLVKVGDTLVYQLQIETKELTSGSVKVVDTLPAEVEFIQDSNNTAGLQVSGQQVSLDLGVLGDSTANMTKLVEFKVKVKDTSKDTFINSAQVTTGSNSNVSDCSHPMTLVKPPTATPAPTPAPGCNESCTTNADCSNSSHICYTVTAGNNRCRLENYPDSTTCTVPTATTPDSPVVPGAPASPAQPELPEQLPVAGADDWTNWLQAGLVTLGVGAVLLLLL